VTPRAVVIGVGNEFRVDDGVGPTVVAALEALVPADVRLVVSDGEPTQLLDAWAGVPLAVVVDAVACEPSSPGSVHRTALALSVGARSLASTHGMGIPDALRLAQVLDRAPGRLIVYAVEAGDLSFGVGLTPPVAQAVPGVAARVLAELLEASAGDVRGRSGDGTPGSEPVN
jgi:hydrogenase maturation protease